MILHQILLQIIDKFHQERTISAGFHLLKGKRSGQTIQDVGIFQLYHYFGILPKISREKYDAHIQSLTEAGYIRVFDDGYYELTATGKEAAQQHFPYKFDGWHYRGNEHVFFARLSLVVQSLSYQQHRKSAFIPIQRNEAIQHWVKQFLLANDYSSRTLQKRLYDEMTASLQALPLEDDLKMLLLQRLAGYKQPGATWQQLAIAHRCSEMDVQLQYVYTLHTWLNTLFVQVTTYPLLAAMMTGVRVEQPLTGSTQQTADLYEQGYTMEQISQMRRLKMSTIEDHIVEMAMQQTQFDLRPFVSVEDERAIYDMMEAYDTKKLKILKEALPHLTYFQIRLVVARGGKSNDTT